MNRMLKISAAVLAVTVVGYAPRAMAQTPKPVPAMAAKHVIMNAADLKWGPAPPGLPPGGQIAVLDGDPGKAGPFVMMAKLPNGYKVPPHWHPTDENITVVAGTLLLGMGDKWSEAGMQAVTAGGFAKMPAKMRHSALTKGETVFQIHGMGPFEITYVNATDDPRKTTTSR